ncbi:hypothetical protein JYG30_19405 [Fibrella sp. USSR17]
MSGPNRNRAGRVVQVRKQQPTMDDINHSPVSLIHIGFAITALLTGTLVILMPKGTVRHQHVGYAYVASMMVVLTTAFGIYRLFGRFGIVHWGALFSWLALIGGVGAAWFRTYLRNWLNWHYLGMCLSVTSLYATFVVEATYRLFPLHLFWWTTVGTSMAVFSIAGWVIAKNSRSLTQPVAAKRTPAERGGGWYAAMQQIRNQLTGATGKS